MTVTALDSALTILHDRGLLNETALEQVCAEMLDTDRPPTREQLGRIFGLDKIFLLCIIPDETARSLVREAVDLLTNPETRLDVRDWVRSAEHVVGGIRRDPRD